MNPYMAFDADPDYEWGALVFASTAKEARRVAWQHGCFDCEFTELRVRRLRGNVSYLMSLYDGEHVYLDDPPTCPVCETWGAPIREDGAGCGNCYGPDPQSPPRFNA